MSKPRNPNIDFGFHAVVPRLIRTGYDMLTPAQKWIYVCLKDLCGDDGTCYRALRTLAEETHVSTGLLSESIPTLHKVGLIHAEKKKRSSGGKEVWHITIADIWQANAKAHPTKRSQREQSPSEERSQNEQTISTDDTDVQNVNQNVHKMNDDSRERSHSEQECSFCETEVITLSNNNIEVITERDNTRITAIADDATPSPSFANGEDDGTNDANTTPLRPDHHSSVNGVTVPVDIRHSEEVNGQPTSTVEIPQVNRLINPVSPLDENIPSTDESPREIERETAEHTPSLPVVESVEDAVIHVDTRNDGTSYSPQSTAKSAPETEQSNFGVIHPEVTEQAEPPATGKGSGKRGGGKGGNKKKQQVNLEEVQPVPPPARPSDEMPWNAKKLLLWADYFRGYTLPVSNHPNSRHYKAEQAAIALIRRGAQERQFLAVMRFMLGVNLKLEEDPEFRDDWWPENKTADVWNAEAHFDEMLKKARQTLKNRRQNAEAKAGVASATMTPQTRQPENQLKAPEGWTARRTAGGGH